MASSYGSSQWFHDAYAGVADDPWGLAWRRSQDFRRLRVLAMLKRLAVPPRSGIDVGCATGDFTALLAAQVPTLDTVLGVDFAEHAIDRARVRYPHLQFARESIMTVGARYPSQFDLVACLEVLYYLDRDQQRDALTSLRRLLRPGGHAIFSSYVGKPPHFDSGTFRALIASAYDVVASEILHLKAVSLAERLASRSSRLLARTTRRADGSRVPAFGRLPSGAVTTIERWSRRVLPFTASHTIVLARARD